MKTFNPAAIAIALLLSKMAFADPAKLSFAEQSIQKWYESVIDRKLVVVRGGVPLGPSFTDQFKLYRLPESEAIYKSDDVPALAQALIERDKNGGWGVSVLADLILIRYQVWDAPKLKTEDKLRQIAQRSKHSPPDAMQLQVALEKAGVAKPVPIFPLKKGGERE